MAKTDLKDLKVKIKAGKVVIGIDRVMKNLKLKQLTKIFVSSNCPNDLKKDINHYANLVGVPVEELSLDNEELGVFCKKNFFISVLGTTEQ